MKTEEETKVRITKLLSDLDAAAQSIPDQTEKARKQIRGLAKRTRAMDLAIKIVQAIKKKRMERMERMERTEAQVQR